VLRGIKPTETIRNLLLHVGIVAPERRIARGKSYRPLADTGAVEGALDCCEI
jgi:hypothetical protein